MTTKAKKAVEVRCPVTGDKVNPATAMLKTVYKGKTYYFCCPGCPEQFKKNPEKYIKK
ncbi:YHS domain-containing protein [Candidatus Saganbacteria bacterium]|nr:YHS domain-containing protein [Candidatus Saganbacteria bacterium]